MQKKYRYFKNLLTSITFLLVFFTIHNISANPVTLKNGLIIENLRVGSGKEAVPNDTVEVHYVGRLEDGTKFDSSYDRNNTFRFTLGARQVIRGWDLGVAGMKEGGKRKLTIPPQLGYGMRGASDSIPPNATLIFVIELIKVHK